MSSTANTTKALRVAVVQMGFREGAILSNLQHATLLVEQAAGDGAKFELLVAANVTLDPSMKTHISPRG